MPRIINSYSEFEMIKWNTLSFYPPSGIFCRVKAYTNRLQQASRLSSPEEFCRTHQGW